MAKQMKRGRRFAEGGSTDQEAADKAAGLEESNKEKPVGFFERMRMGNIDDSSSEAYKRFGAGRGAASRASKATAEEPAPKKVAQVKVEEKYGEDERPAPTGMGAATKLVSKPSVAETKITAVTSKPAASKAQPKAQPKAESSKAETPRMSREESIAAIPTGGYPKRMSREESIAAIPAGGYPKRMSREESIAAIPTGGYPKVAEGESASGSELGRNVKNTLNAMVGTKLPVGLANAAAERAAMGRAKDGASKAADKLIAERTARIAARRKAAGAKEALRRDATFEGGMKRGGKVKAYASGGSVSASRRGDGIATKGKTRGKMC